ncbi:MAG: hypothetical protein JSW66_01975 [Phycisphaerales bacterium]|nr:MAG: hypothetical protein JSW66_01975 [Phycisphaerales bacterium]
MRRCSVYEKLRIVPGGLNDYKRLARYHYREIRPGPCKAVFALKSDGTLPGLLSTTVVGVVVYSSATAVLQLRNAATDDFFAGLDRGTQLGLINRNIRRISRLIIEPRFRRLGLATRLVRETMPRLDVPIVEAVAVMGLVNPFLEKAGMRAYRAKPHTANVRLMEAFSLLGIESAELVDAAKVQQKLDGLTNAGARFIEQSIHQFLKSHGRRRDMPPGLERTRYILSRLATRPVYYIWFNPKFNMGGSIDHACEESGKEVC